jgi:hypothetical protein
MLGLDLLEWRGIRPAEIALPPVISTTGLIELISTTLAYTFEEFVDDNVPMLMLCIGACGMCVLFTICGFILRENFRHVSKTFVGAARLLKIMGGDDVRRVVPTGDPKPAAWRTQPLDPLPDHKAIARRAADARATLELEDAVRDAYFLGTQHLITSTRQPDPDEKQVLIMKLKAFQDRGLERRGGQVALEIVHRAQTWINILDAERALVRYIEIGNADLIKRVTEEDFRIEYQWDRVEDLAVAIKVGRAEKASPSLVATAQELFVNLVARCKELPADRTVLDPSGEGVRILPAGNQRAIWATTGENYTYETGSLVGRNLPGASEDDTLPCRPNELGNVGVDPTRPVCSIYHAKGFCAHGRRCPWRHCKPLPGDSIREPLGIDEP